VAEITFSDPDSSPVPKILNLDPGPGPIFFKFENLTPVQIPATIDATEIQQCFYLRNGIYTKHVDSCHCRK